MPEAGKVRIFEVAPRDGLQNEKRLIPAADKIRLIDMLSGCGFERIEAASFVSPKWVPQMADAETVMAGIARVPGIAYAALTPNLKGYDRAKAAGTDEVAVFASASEGFSKANLNCTIAESIARLQPVIAAAKTDGIPVRGYVSCVTDCPFDGPTKPADTARIAAVLAEAGCYEVSLGDTIGHATPKTIAAMLEAVLENLPAERLAGHYHDTRGRALENIAVSLEFGVRTFDASAGGLGGCPYAPGAAGNVATEAVIQLVEDKGYETGLDAAKLAQAANFARSLRTNVP